MTALESMLDLAREMARVSGLPDHPGYEKRMTFPRDLLRGYAAEWQETWFAK